MAEPVYGLLEGKKYSDGDPLDIVVFVNQCAACLATLEEVVDGSAPEACTASERATFLPWF